MSRLQSSSHATSPSPAAVRRALAALPMTTNEPILVLLLVWCQLFHPGHLCNWLTGLISALDEDCVQKGIEFIPARLMQKRPKDAREEVSRGRTSKQGNGTWAPSSSEEDGDSEDSMSDLYPSHLFTLKNPTEATTGGDGNEEEDDFHTDDGEDMEVDTPALQKRKKVRVQGGGTQKKLRNNRWKSGRKKREVNA
ncbi:Surfeit locus protein 2 [Takifugu flavidus]|uniref:Surfeit locus protein 2 n=1 Tax=Takifugu flavidus TaxID=433684 RepID=A0A5C6NGI8_9TELE|nr:Surfeit locus protein 2 [Takifugu flavidus]